MNQSWAEDANKATAPVNPEQGTVPHPAPISHAPFRALVGLGVSLFTGLHPVLQALGPLGLATPNKKAVP